MAKAIGRDYGDKSCKGRMAETLLKRYYVTNITPLQHYRGVMGVMSVMDVIGIISIFGGGRG